MSADHKGETLLRRDSWSLVPLIKLAFSSLFPSLEKVTCRKLWSNHGCLSSLDPECGAKFKYDTVWNSKRCDMDISSTWINGQKVYSSSWKEPWKRIRFEETFVNYLSSYTQTVSFIVALPLFRCTIFIHFLQTIQI